MKKDVLTVKGLAAELRMSPKSIQRACVVVSEKRANGRTSETEEIVLSYEFCVVWPAATQNERDARDWREAGDGLSGSPIGQMERTK